MRVERSSVSRELGSTAGVPATTAALPNVHTRNGAAGRMSDAQLLSGSASQACPPTLGQVRTAPGTAPM